MTGFFFLCTYFTMTVKNKMTTAQQHHQSEAHFNSSPGEGKGHKPAGTPAREGKSYIGKDVPTKPFEGGFEAASNPVDLKRNHVVNKPKSGSPDTVVYCPQEGVNILIPLHRKGFIPALDFAIKEPLFWTLVIDNKDLPVPRDRLKVLEEHWFQRSAIPPLTVLKEREALPESLPSDEWTLSQLRAKVRYFWPKADPHYPKVKGKHLTPRQVSLLQKAVKTDVFYMLLSNPLIWIPLRKSQIKVLETEFFTAGKMLNCLSVHFRSEYPIGYAEVVIDANQDKENRDRQDVKTKVQGAGKRNSALRVSVSKVENKAVKNAAVSRYMSKVERKAPEPAKPKSSSVQQNNQLRDSSANRKPAPKIPKGEDGGADLSEQKPTELSSEATDFKFNKSEKEENSKSEPILIDKQFETEPKEVSSDMPMPIQCVVDNAEQPNEKPDLCNSVNSQKDSDAMETATDLPAGELFQAKCEWNGFNKVKSFLTKPKPTGVDGKQVENNPSAKEDSKTPEKVSKVSWFTKTDSDVCKTSVKSKLAMLHIPTVKEWKEKRAAKQEEERQWIERREAQENEMLRRIRIDAAHIDDLFARRVKRQACKPPIGEEKKAKKQKIFYAPSRNPPSLKSKLAMFDIPTVKEWKENRAAKLGEKQGVECTLPLSLEDEKRVDKQLRSIELQRCKPPSLIINLASLQLPTIKEWKEKRVARKKEEKPTDCREAAKNSELHCLQREYDDNRDSTETLDCQSCKPQTACQAQKKKTFLKCWWDRHCKQQPESKKTCSSLPSTNKKVEPKEETNYSRKEKDLHVPDMNHKTLPRNASKLQSDTKLVDPLKREFEKKPNALDRLRNFACFILTLPKRKRQEGQEEVNQAFDDDPDDDSEDRNFTIRRR